MYGQINKLTKYDSNLVSKGYVFFDTSNPIVLWNLARGVLNTTQELINYFGYNNFISFFLKSRIENKLSYYELEVELEQVRKFKYPNKPSRLTGLFFFPDKEQANLAMKYINVRHFQEVCLTEINLNPYCKNHKYDMNWITFYNDCKKDYPSNWMELYWEGKICNYKNKDIPPIWECITDNGFLVEDEKIKLNNIERIKDIDEQLLILLYISIWAAYYGYAYGCVCYQLVYSKIGSCRHICPTTFITKEIEKYTLSRLQIDDPNSYNAIINLFEKYNWKLKRPDYLDIGYCIDCQTQITKCKNFKLS